ncbi:MAG: ThuA domain-containing protein [Planctomycetes bacterium]|nr:ThuA domain-containing protein [Planctomycetota bacterium]
MKSNRCVLHLAFACVLLTLPLISYGASDASDKQPPSKPIRVLIIDGQNNHDWKLTTPLLRKALESARIFKVDVATSPPSGADMSGFRPRFADYDVVVSNYNGDRWLAETEKEFEAFIAGGGGFVSVHAANNAFPGWPEYNRMIGLGGWYGRTEKSGPYVYVNKAGAVTHDMSPGPGGHHGPQHEFQIRMRDTKHPIMRGLPDLWMHTKDELYDSLRGPAENLHVLATAYSAPQYDGTRRHEPMLMTLNYGKGRVFHTVLGHADYSMNCIGFITTFQRGAEWAATGKVTIDVPKDFPTADKPSSLE